MRSLVVLGLCAVLSGCVVAKGYQRLEWAPMSQDQARAECQHEIQMGSSLDNCMRAKGYAPVY